MTITWTNGVDIAQDFVAAPWSFKVMDIPAGMIPGSGILICAFSINGFAGSRNSFGGVINRFEYADSGFGLTLSILDALGNTIGSDSVNYTFGNYELVNPALNAGGSIWLSSDFFPSTVASQVNEEIVTGIVVAAIDSTTWDPTTVSEIQVPAGFGAPPISVAGLNPPPSTRADAIYGFASEDNSATVPGNLSFASDPNWTDIIQRFTAYSACARNVSFGEVVTGSPFQFDPFPIGTLPVGATTVLCQLEVEGSGIGTIPSMFAEFDLIDAGGAVLSTPCSIFLPSGGGILFAVGKSVFNAGAAGIRVQGTLGGPIPGLVQMLVGWAAIVYCNFDDMHSSHSATLAQWTGTLPVTASQPYAFTATGPVPTTDTFLPVFQGDVAVSLIGAPALGRAFAQIIG